MFQYRARLTLVPIIALTAFAQPACSAAYPIRPIELVVPGPAGGTPDAVARMIGERLGAHMGQQIIISNRSGASGFIGVQAVQQAKPDGYTLLMGFAQTMAVNPVTFKKIPYDPIKDFSPVARLAEFELVLAVPASLPVDNVDELIAWLKQHKSRASFGSFGAGSPSQFAGETFGRMSGTDAIHVPYKGSAPLVTDLVGGQVQYGFVVLQVAQQLAHAGKLKLLAVTGKKRQISEPDVPTMAEAGYGEVQATGWYGVYAPAGTPGSVRSKLQAGLEQVMNEPALQKQLLAQGVRPAFLDAEAFGAYNREEIARWRAIAEKTGFKALE